MQHQQRYGRSVGRQQVLVHFLKVVLMPNRAGLTHFVRRLDLVEIHGWDRPSLGGVLDAERTVNVTGRAGL